MHKWLIVILLAVLILPVHAQIDEEYSAITRTNVTDLTIMAMLNIDDSIGAGLDYFGNNDIEWSSDGEWLGIGYNTMLYVYNFNRLQNSPFAFDMRQPEILPGCGTNLDYVVKDISFHPSRAIVAVTSYSELRIYDLESGEQIGSEDEIHANDIRFLDDGSLVLNDFDGTLYRVNVDTMLFTILDVLSEPNMLQISDDGQIYTSNSYSGTVVTLDAATGQEVRRYDPPLCVQQDSGGCGYTPDTDTLAVNGGLVSTNDAISCDVRDVNIWDADTGEVLTELSTPSKFLAISSDGTLIAADGEDDFAMTQLYNTQNGDLIMTLPNTSDTVDVEFSPDGSILATMNGQAGLVQLWTVPENLPSREALQSLSNTIVDADCDTVQTVRDGVTVSIAWSWYAQTVEQVYEHIENAIYDLTVDDIQAQRWIFLSQPEQYAPNGADTWTVFYYMPVGTETLGNHTVYYELTWTNTISDGFNSFGTDGNVQGLSGTCEYLVGG